MMNRKPLCLFAVAILLASCQREMDCGVAPEIRARVESESTTRTSLSVDDSGTGTIYWNPSDRIDVFYGTKRVTYASKNTSDAEEASFTTNDSVSDSDLASTNIWGLYPSNSASSCSGSAVTTTLPSTQYGVPGTFDDDLFMAVAHSTTTDLQFYNVCGGIKFNLAFDDIKKITFKGNNNEYIAGKVSISIVNGLPKATVVSGSKTITLTPKSGSTFTKGEDYYITLLPGTLSKGFTMTFTATDGTVGTINYSDKAVTIKRSVFSRKKYMDVYGEFGDERQANNVIYYTSSDGKVVTPRWADRFGANLVSNEYVGGKGIITFDGDVTSIGASAFYNCTSLTSIDIPNSVMSIGDYAFYYCTKLSSIDIPDSITSIGSSAFYNCISLISIDIPTSIDWISDCSFSGCRSLTSIEIPNSVVTIDNHAFEGCSGLKSVLIPNSVERINSYAFHGCSGLTTVDLPQYIFYVGIMAFGACSNMTSIVARSLSPASLGSDSFAGTNDCPIYVPEGKVDTYKSSWSYYSDRIQQFCPKNVILYTSYANSVTPAYQDGFGANIVANSLVGYDNNGDSIWKLIFDGEVTSIGDWAFYGCTGLLSITIPNSVNSIGERAFSECRYLSRITIPESVSNIGNNAFNGCYGMKSMIFLNPTPPSITENTFNFDSEYQPPRDFFYHIFVPKGSVSAYKNAKNWNQYSSCMLYIENSELIYPMLPFLASGFYVPTYDVTEYVDLTERKVYSVNPFNLISFYDDGGNPVYLYGVWLEGNGDNGIPSGLNAQDFYNLYNREFTYDTSSVPEQYRDQTTFSWESDSLIFDYSQGDVLTESFTIYLSVSFGSFFRFDKSFGVRIVFRAAGS